MAAVTIFSDFGAHEEEICHCFNFFPFYLPWSDGTGCHDLGFFLILSFKIAFFLLSSFTFIKRLFSSSLLFAIRVVSSTYLRLLIFLPAILIPAWNSSSPIFHMMYSAWKLNRVTIYSLVVLLSQFWTISCSMWYSECCLLTHIQVSQETDKMVHLYSCPVYHQYCFSMFHTYVLIYNICFSLSDLIHSV